MRIFGGAAVLAAIAAAQPAAARPFSLAPPRVASAATTAGSGFRFLPPVTATAAPALPLRHRPNSAMMELYPLAGSGFHLSAGPQLFARRGMAASTWASLGGAAPVSRSGSGMARGNYRRLAPVMTAGYTVELAPSLTMGVEGGAIEGRLFSGPPGVPHRGGGHGGTRNAANPLVQMVFGFDF